ncbi:TPA: hypothetical protein DIC40_07485 [Patescibacteria group bacterium]|nr:hypothetical protein P148_SR1C00001G0820 [candidate division SR1 bacterium RAAC1_SR1_1]HCY21633.1 hypothetical protein [Candidatus Gracilibacteria bacterium]
MKKLLIIAGILIVAFFVLMYFTQDMGYGTYSEGYRMGKLNKFSSTGLIFKSCEGDLLLGKESSYYFDMKDSVLINPWQFSLSTKSALVSNISQYANKYVVIKYRQYRIGPLNWENEYEPLEISPLDTSIAILPYQEQGIDGLKSEGFRIGRVVKLSKRGTITKSYEVMFQLSNIGNDFMSMSVTDENIYRSLMTSLLSGKQIMIHYKKQFMHNPFGQDTDYVVWKVEKIV